MKEGRIVRVKCLRSPEGWGTGHKWRVWCATLSIVGGKTEFGYRRRQLVDLIMGEEGSSYLTASTFLPEASSLTKGIGGGDFGGQV